MKKLSINLPIIVLLALILAACARPPVEEMNMAHDAVIRAENDADAVNHAGNILIRARDALVRMEIEADVKRYDAAKQYAAEAISAAERALAEGRSGSNRARDEALNLVNSLEVPLAETSSALSAARQVRDIDLNFNALSWDLDVARRDYNDARQSLAAENYQDAISSGQNARSLLADINASISTAAHATARKQ